MSMAGAFQSKGKIRTAVVTGNHPFDVPGFHALFRSIPEIEFYLQDLDNLVADWGQAFEQYHVLLFYNMHTKTPGGKAEKVLAQLGESKQGLFVLHHALLAFPEWQTWSEICGIADRSFEYYPEQSIRVQVANPQHPVTNGLASWNMVDETYLMHDAGKGSDIFLTVAHPKSMNTIAWTRQHKDARVFCCALGHDNRAYADPNFRTVVTRGIQWAGRRI
jgi:type 1 glutamine amidotransferase